MNPSLTLRILVAIAPNYLTIKLVDSSESSESSESSGGVLQATQINIL